MCRRPGGTWRRNRATADADIELPFRRYRCHSPGLRSVINGEMSDDQGLRRLSFGIAYRMLGSVADAEDIVQETWLRLHKAQEQDTTIESERAYVAAVTTRLAIDHLRSARVKRESYVGNWLPEPLVSEVPEVVEQTEMAESLSMAFLTIMESLSPVERAVFLLREAFDYEYEEIATVVGKSEDNCRQLFARARKHLEVGKPRFEASAEKREELAASFFSACERGDLAELEHVLAADVVFYGDGGGKATAATQPVIGSDRVGRFLAGLFTKVFQFGLRMRRVTVNGQPGAMLLDPEGRLMNVMSLDIADGRVAAIRAVVNPEKLGHLGEVSDLLRIRGRQ
jgi:RNA polymerase sigma-70 factor (ECF subfamily)